MRLSFATFCLSDISKALRLADAAGNVFSIQIPYLLKLCHLIFYDDNIKVALVLQLTINLILSYLFAFCVVLCTKCIEVIPFKNAIEKLRNLRHNTVYRFNQWQQLFCCILSMQRWPAILD